MECTLEVAIATLCVLCVHLIFSTDATFSSIKISFPFPKNKYHHPLKTGLSNRYKKLSSDSFTYAFKQLNLFYYWFTTVAPRIVYTLKRDEMLASQQQRARLVVWTVY